MRAVLTGALLLTLLALPGRAQETTEDKLREALRHALVDLRALQDSQAQLKADHDSAVAQRDQLQQQLTQLQAQLADAEKNAKPAAPAVDQQQLQKLSDELAEMRRQNTTLQASNTKWQAAYNQAAALAQARDAEAKRLATALAAAEKTNDVDHEINKKLAALASDILHLYRAQSFRSILLEGYEPLLGLKQVELENIVQGYEDKIYGLRLFTAKTP